MKDKERNPIYIITVFEEFKPQPHESTKTGCKDVVGFKHSFERADEVVRENTCDIHEDCYNYAVIEEVFPYLYPDSNRTWFYKFNKESGAYKPFDVPEYLFGRTDFWCTLG